LGEETAISDRPPNHPLLSWIRGSSVGVLAAFALAFSACGDDESQRQDANEPSGDFPVAVTSGKFPTEQRLAETEHLQLEVENVGTDTIPNLAVTIRTGDGQSSGPFSVRSDQPGLADANRPVWILEQGWPKLLPPGEDLADIEDAPTAGAGAAQTNTFAFGPLEAGETIDIVWKLTPVEAGTFTVSYELAAGLNGKAKAVSDDGSPVEGEFVVTISDKPPRATVGDNGDVELQGE
jgi:hypothetical protein